MFSSVFGRFSACRSSLVKLLSGRGADCIVEAILLLMLSLADSESSLSGVSISSEVGGRPY